MSDWQIRIPYRSRSDTLADVAEAARELPQGESRDVARQVALGALVDGTAASAGELIDQIEQATPTERRKMLDTARVKAGLPDTQTVEARRKVEIASNAARLTASKESPWQLCAAEGCKAMPINELGAPMPVNVRRWWCAAHRDQAADGDMEPRPSRLHYSSSGAIVEYDPDEAARAQATAESRRRQLEAELADRAVEAAAKRENDEARAARARSELPQEFRW